MSRSWVFVEMLAELGFSLDYEQILREFSGASMAKRMDVTRRRLAWSAPPDFVEAFDRRLALAMSRELQPVPGVPEALTRQMRARLGQVGLLHHFEPHLFSAAEVARGKPAPDVFLHAADRMGVLQEAGARVFTEMSELPKLLG